MKTNTEGQIVHTTIGVYANGDMKFNGVRPEDLEAHKEYNLSARPGRAFFVDGVCINKGYLDDKQVAHYEKLFKSDAKYIQSKYSSKYH